MITDYLYIFLMLGFGINSMNIIKILPQLPPLIMDDSIDNLVGYLPFFKICHGQYNCWVNTVITILSTYYLIIMTTAFISSHYIETIEQITYFYKRSHIRRLKYSKITRAIAFSGFLPIFMTRQSILIYYLVDYAILMGIIALWHFIVPINKYQRDYDYKMNLMIGNIAYFVGISIGLQ
jgi:hypothetical protein